MDESKQRRNYLVVTHDTFEEIPNSDLAGTPIPPSPPDTIAIPAHGAGGFPLTTRLYLV